MQPNSWANGGSTRECGGLGAEVIHLRLPRRCPVTGLTRRVPSTSPTHSPKPIRAASRVSGHAPITTDVAIFEPSPCFTSWQVHWLLAANAQLDKGTGLVQREGLITFRFRTGPLAAG